MQPIFMVAGTESLVTYTINLGHPANLHGGGAHIGSLAHIVPCSQFIEFRLHSRMQQLYMVVGPTQPILPVQSHTAALIE